MSKSSIEPNTFVFGVAGGDLRISVIICAYTEARWEALCAAVRSLQGQTLSPFEIIVVVDHNERLLFRLREHFSDNIMIAHNAGPRGLSGARNSGVALAQGEVVTFLDDDAAAEPDWLAQLIAEYSGPAVMGVGGAVEPKWLDKKPDWLPEEFYWVVGCSYRGMPTKKEPVRNFIGANMSFRRSIFSSMDNFQTELGRVGTLPAGCEETELCIRVTKREGVGSLIYTPNARVHHQVPAARCTWAYFWSRCYAEGVSKAAVSRLVGRQQGLATERRYTLQTLPQGVFRGVGETLRRRNAQGLLRSGAIITGLFITAAGYFVGTVESMLSVLKRVTPTQQII